MASTNIILAVPSANSSVNYELPQNESAKLSFAPEDIDGLKLDGAGGLNISFVEGGNVTITNFQAFIDNGNTLSLADGTTVDPKLLFNALKGENDNPFPAQDVTKIGIPAEGVQREITLEPGKKYLFNFDLSETKGADVKDGKMIVGFGNGSQIIIANYETAMADKNPPELSLASKTCVVTGDELITDIQKLAQTAPLEETPLVVEEKPEHKHKSKIADADMHGKADIGPGDQTKLAYSEDDLAKKLAAIETAAGGATAGGRRSGYGFESRFTPDPFNGKPDIGPINPTELGYRAPRLTPSEFVALDTPPPPADSNPIAIGPAARLLDETNLAGGPISTSGAITIDFGADGNGGIRPNGNFSVSGSVDNNVLSSNGDPITVTVVGNSYIGKTFSGDVVFDLVIDTNTGNFVFTQYLPLDHANGNDPNDKIVMDFGVVARDGDGDSVSTRVEIIIADDGPNAAGGSGSVDETDFGTAISTSGNITVVFGQDGPGRVQADGTFSAGGSLKNGALTTGGVPVVVTSTLNGYEGKANGVTVFTLVLNPATGAFTYTQFKPLDHGDINDPNDVIQLTFGTNVVDFDGDSAPAPIVISIFDDVPEIQSCGCGPKPDVGMETVDESNLGPIVETGKLDADFGSDVPGSYVLKPGSFVSTGSKANGALTHMGVPVVVTLENGVYVGKAGTLTIFTLEVTASTGDYKFTLFNTLDHADASNPDDVIVLDFGVIVYDYEGDSAEGLIRINVKDDAPVANDDSRSLPEGGGTVTGNVTTNDVSGQDTPAVVTQIVFQGVTYTLPANGNNVTIPGAHGTLVINKDGVYTYTSNPNATGIDQFTYTLRDFDGDSDTAILSITVTDTDTIPDIIKPADEIVDETNLVSGVITETGTIVADFKDDGPGTISGNGNFASSGSKLNGALTSNGLAVVVTYANGVYTGKAGATTVFTLEIATNGSYTFKQFEQLDHADGANPNDVIALDFGVVATDADGDIATTTVTVRVLDDAPDARDDGSSVAEGGTVSGNVTSNDVSGQDVPGKVTKVTFNGVSQDVPLSGQLSVVGTYGTLKIDQSGAWTYTANANADGIDNFTYTLRDFDGDIDTAILSKTVTDTDTIPDIIKPADEIVDETNLAGGVITETGTIVADFKDDGPGTIAGNGSFTSSGSKLNGALTSNGVAVVVSYLNGVYTGKVGTTTVFTMEIATNGSYTFKLFEQLDHADGANPNDVIALDFGVVATDVDGDIATTTVTVRVLDDAPDARDDGSSVTEGGTVSGNVTNNDVSGQDVPAKVTSVTFSGTAYAVPAVGQLTIVATYGTLKIDQSGAWTYTANANADGIDNFTYTLRDFDGDIDTAILSISVDDTDTIPTVIKPADEIVDETNLAGGVITETGTIVADFKDDGPGTISGNGNFASSGSKLNGALTSNGLAVVVTYANGVYTGKAGATTVFTLEIATNGSYTFKQFEQLDHADGANPNDVIALDFGVVATDADGDIATTTVTVRVLDDAPRATDDGAFVSEGGTVNGNVTSNDVFGQDVPAKVVKITFGTTTYDIPATGQLTVVGTYGTFKIDQSGVWTYTAKANADGVDQFFYTLRDYDGDTDVACLSVTVADTDTTPTIVKPADEIVDETNLAGGVITETGTIVADFKDDGPGTISGNGNFASSGSKLNGALTSNGVAVVVTYANGVYTGKAGATTVFTLEIATNGSYTFKQFEQLDHADGNNPNDIIALDFGVVATDADGDIANTTVTVRVLDDAPHAVDDGSTVSEGATVFGNVTSNDTAGQDIPGKVVKITFNGTSYDIPSVGQLTVNGTYGTFNIDQTGAWSYTARVNANGVDQFFYTLRDYDGDTDVACLSLTVNDTDTIPTITKPADKILDETNLAGGVITETGSIVADFKDDGPGTISGNGSFTSSGSKLNGALTSNGVAVVVTYANGVYTGKAGATTVFTLEIATNGSYTFRQYEQLDHADGNNPNDVITLDFGVVATDADGDTATTSVTVHVLDDAPTVAGDFCTIVGTQEQVGSNALLNDNIGQDAPGRVTAVTFGGTTVQIPTSGTVDIWGLHGVLTIAASGAYLYKHTDNVFGVSEEFTVRVSDYDGDTAVSQLQINLVGRDLRGTEGRDSISGSNNNEAMYGNGGDDWLYGNGGHDYIDGGQGNDIITGDAGNDELVGREGNDTIYGGDGDDTLFGDGANTDTYAGNDIMYGDAGNDFMYGRRGDDYMDGGTGDDVLYGEEGNDTILGGAGNDHIIAGAGHDVVTGGAGADMFWFMNISEGVDTIKDFNMGEGDKLELSNVLTNFDPLTNAINDFVFATHEGNNTTILANNSGTGIAGATALAVLENVNVNVTDLFNNGSLVT